MDHLEYLKKVVGPFPRKVHIYTTLNTLFRDFVDVLPSPEVPRESFCKAVVSKMGGGKVHAPQGVGKMIHWRMEFSICIYFLPCKGFILCRLYSAQSVSTIVTHTHLYIDQQN